MGAGCAITLLGVGVGSAGLIDGNGAIGSGLLEGELSSLLGGVLNGETRASIEARRASGFKALVIVFAAGRTIAAGFAGMRGLSARLTGGGLAGDFDSSISCTLATALEVSERSVLDPRGEAGRDDARLDCCEMSSRTFANGVLSRRSGDREALRSKYVRGGDLGESTLTDGVS